MKKQWKGFLSGVIVTILVCSMIVPAAAAVLTKTATLYYKDIKILLDGNEIRPTTEHGDYVEPFIVDGTTYLPVRGISSALGLDVSWDGKTNTVSLSHKSNTPQNGTYKIGDTWVVDGQWELTITGVKETKERNEYWSTNPGAVYIVDYTYRNIGYIDSSEIMDGLFISIDDMIVDSAGNMGESYPLIVSYPKETPVGAICHAQACIGVSVPGTFHLTVNDYDGNLNKQSATFEVSVK